MANKLKNCPECGRIFIDTGVGMCRDCLDKQEQTMIEISSYVRDHPHCTVKEVCDEMHVKEKLVMKMLREGRFITEGIHFEYPCAGGCGTMILEGKYCDKCQKAMKEKMVAAQEKITKIVAEKHEQGPGMYSKDMGIKHH